jgi:hypothetical protein
MVMMMRGAGGREEVQNVAKECDHYVSHVFARPLFSHTQQSSLCTQKSDDGRELFSFLIQHFIITYFVTGKCTIRSKYT